jgi:hypothetical protein
VLCKQLGIKSAMLVSALESSMEPYLDCGNRKLSVKRSLLAPTFSSLISHFVGREQPYPLHRPWEQGSTTEDSALRNVSSDGLGLV